MIDSMTKSKPILSLDGVRRYITHHREIRLCERLLEVKREINLERLERATDRFLTCLDSEKGAR